VARDRVQPQKIESPGSGGTQADSFQTALNPNEDFVDSRGLTVQNATSGDDTVGVERDTSNNLVLFDPVTGSKTLADLAASSSGITAEQHKALRQLIHFIDEGPAEGFASGAYKETLPSADPFPTSIIWWESSGKTQKIVELSITWSGAFATVMEWKVYDEDGTTLLATVSDAISYSGAFETTRTRTITLPP